MRFLPILSATLLLSATLSAQTPGTPTVVIAPPPSANCPVSFAAQHTPGGEIRNVEKGSSGDKQSYDLTLTPAPSSTLRKVTIVLHGLSGQHMQPAAATGNTPATAETVTLTPWIGQDHRFHATVTTGKLTAVQWVELTALTYADGTAWHSSPTAACRVAPDGFMLVATRR